MPGDGTKVSAMGVTPYELASSLCPLRLYFLDLEVMIPSGVVSIAWASGFRARS